jgi:hypothetical protein
MYWFRPTTFIDEHDPNYPYAGRSLREVTPEEAAFVVEMLKRMQERLGAGPTNPGVKE